MDAQPSQPRNEESAVEVNRRTWNRWARWHSRSQYYDLERFVQGWRTLDDVELAGFPDVEGRTLLHLQCQLGTESLSWAERGAIVTGIDFSEQAIRTARGLSERTGISARFLVADVLDLPHDLDGRFERVFSSHGVLLWLPDLERWAQGIARALVPGGLFYLVEVHPIALMFDNDRTDGRLVPVDPYFHTSSPRRQVEAGSYASPERPERSESFIWFHSLADILGGLLGAGLEIRAFREYPFMGWRLFPWMVEESYNHWRLPPESPQIPLGFSLLARKPAVGEERP